jgi:hypothetical protein
VAAGRQPPCRWCRVGGSRDCSGRCHGRSAIRGENVTSQYLIGELSVRLEQLQSVAVGGEVRDVTRLRYEIENGGTGGLGPAAARAIELADVLCWRSLARGDMAAFSSQAGVSADLRLFGVCARLLGDG